MTADASTAWRRPSLDAPIVYSIRAGVRKPAAMFSSRRLFTSRTGRRVRRESSAARIPCGPTPNFEPNPPPMNSQMTRTRSGSSPNASAIVARAS